MKIAILIVALSIFTMLGTTPIMTQAYTAKKVIVRKKIVKKKIVKKVVRKKIVKTALSILQNRWNDCKKQPQSIEVIKAQFGNKSDVAIKTACFESGLNCNAKNTRNTNGTIDYGLFQMNSINKPNLATVFDCETNAKIAYKKSKGGVNWKPWYAHRTYSLYFNKLK